MELVSAKYQRKVLVIVDAEQRAGPLMAGGTVVANAGDWIVTSGSGESYVMTDADFKKEYEPVPLQQG